LIDHTLANEPASYEDATNTANHTQEVKRKMENGTETEMETELKGKREQNRMV